NLTRALIYPYGYVPTLDLDGSGRVDVIDIVIVALAFGSRPGDPHWNPYADINQDGVVDIQDIVILAIHFGETWP
ncbi:MAG: dockerin type I domain-containing protein, partial [Candidatus Hodarchaeota archaeon]